MKKWFAILLCTLGLLALACTEEPPKKPVCAEGQITVTESVWVDGTTIPSFYEAREYIDPVYSYTCPTVTWPKQTYYDKGWKSFGPITFTYDKSSDPNKCHRPTASSLGVPSKLTSDFNHDFPEWKDATKTLVTPGYYTDWEVVSYCKVHDHENTCRYTKAVEVPGYWTKPVCRDPNVSEETVVDCTGVYGVTTTEGVPAEPVLLFAWADPLTIETFEDFVEPSECLVVPPEVCKPINYTWFRCNSGAWTYTPGGSADKCWCGGLTGEKAAKESYDCGKTWTWYNNGVKVPPMGLGFYAAPACNIGGWCAK